MPFFQGLLVGLSTALILGPVFFTLLKNSLQKGTKAGYYTAFGIIVSDIIVVAICYLITGAVLDEFVKLPWFKFIAAGLLIGFAIGFIRNPFKEVEVDESIRFGKGYFKAFYQGFLVNGVNPAVFVLWITFIGTGKAITDGNSELIIYLIGILVGIFSTDMAKAYGAKVLSSKLQSKFLPIIFKVFGLILIGVAVKLIYDGVADLV